MKEHLVSFSRRFSRRPRPRSDARKLIPFVKILKCGVLNHQGLNPINLACSPMAGSVNSRYL